MNKLSAVDRNRVSDALAKCAAETKAIEDPEVLAETAYQMLSKDLGDNPGLFKAACQVYNSCKSIHKLAEADDNTRGNDFALLDVQKLSGRLANERKVSMRKAASASVVFSEQGRTPTASLNKAASETVRKPVDDVVRKPLTADFNVRKHLNDELSSIEEVLRKSASALKMAESAASAAVAGFISAMATERPAVRKEAAARMSVHFGEDFDKLMSKFNSTRPQQALSSAEYHGKYCGTPSLPKSLLVEKTASALKAVAERDMLSEFCDTIAKQMAEQTLEYGAELIRLRKAASATAAAAGGGGALALSKMLGLEDVDPAKVKAEIHNTQMVNAILAHSYQRAFMHAVLNNAIRKYPLHKSVAAFNAAVSKLPPNTRLVPATANQKLIEGLMIDALTTGSVPSKADTETISTLADTIGKLNTVKGEYTANAVDGSPRA